MIIKANNDDKSKKPKETLPNNFENEKIKKPIKTFDDSIKIKR